MKMLPMEPATVRSGQLCSGQFMKRKEFCAIAIVGKSQEKEEFDYCAPCGICRQVMAEFCDPDTFQVIVAKSTEDYKIYLLKELLPLSFNESSLGK